MIVSSLDAARLFDFKGFVGIMVAKRWVLNGCEDHYMDEWQIAERIEVDGRVLLLIEVKSGINKPYCTNGGVYITKSGADKRRISQEELQRLFQESQRFYADESLVAGSGITDLDENLLATYCEVTNIKHGISVI